MTMNLQHCTRGVAFRGEHNTQRGRVVMITWIHAGPSVVAAFLGSLVECVEAATIVLAVGTVRGWRSALAGTLAGVDRKSTRLNSSHLVISYAVFCLKKKKIKG